MYALAPIVRLPDPYHGRLWLHRDALPEPAYTGEFALRQWAPDQAEVEGLAADYLPQSWMSDGHLDWCLVNALTFREIAGYEATLAISFPKPWTAGWVFQTLFAAWIP